MHDYNLLNEDETRYNLIDPLVKKAGWDLADRRSVGFEIPVDGYDASPINGITDYCLFRDNREVLAVIEAKRTSHDARGGKEQLYQYITNVEKRQSFLPFGFLSNRDHIWVWDSSDCRDHVVADFFSKDDLKRLLFIKQNLLTQKRKLEAADLYEAPFTNFRLNAVEKLFSDDEVEEILELTKRLIA